MIKIENDRLLFLPVLVVYLIGMFIDIMAVDPAQYSAMAMEMLQTGNYLEIYYRGEDYLDKPPLIFWTAALSYKLFGVSTFAYKLPSILFTLLGLWATFRLGKMLYSRNAGFYAALILASCQAWFLINHDVKTDNIMVACTIVAIWQLAAFTRNKKIIHIVYAALGIAGAMLTKGPIGIMVPVLALGTDYILKRRWDMFLRWEWLLLLVLVFICLLPMLYGLYTQFDMSPGKQTYNGTITSGLRFYFWTQSFGRITGESTWKNDTDPFFFVHTFLWAFLPWCIIFLFAFIRRINRFWKYRFLLRESNEAITLGGIVFPMIAFSLSQYKLPHYIFVIFPLAAILTGSYIAKMVDESRYENQFKALRIIQNILAPILIVLVFAICLYTFPITNAAVWIVGLAGLIILLYYIFQKGTRFQRLLLPSFIAIVTANFLLNVHFYPNLLQYQAASVAGQLVKSSPTHYPVVCYKTQHHSFDFYYEQIAPRIDSAAVIQEAYAGQTIWVFTNEIGYPDLKQQAGWKIIEEKALDDYRVSRLQKKFLNPKTRHQAVGKKYLLLVEINS